MTARGLVAAPVYRALFVAPVVAAFAAGVSGGVGAAALVSSSWRVVVGLVVALSVGAAVWEGYLHLRTPGRRAAFEVVLGWADSLADWARWPVYDTAGHFAGRTTAEFCARAALVDEMTTRYGDATGWTSAMWDEYADRAELVRAAHAGGAR